jgi:hypothetical protein
VSYVRGEWGVRWVRWVRWGVVGEVGGVGDVEWGEWRWVRVSEVEVSEVSEWEWSWWWLCGVLVNAWGGGDGAEMPDADLAALQQPPALATQRLTLPMYTRVIKREREREEEEEEEER